MRFDVSYKGFESVTAFGNTNQTQGHMIEVDRDIIITSVYMYRGSTSSTMNVAPRIYNSSNQLIGTSPSISTTGAMQGNWIKFTLTNPVTMKKNEKYKLLFYFDGSNPIGGQGGFSDVNLMKLSTSDNKTNFTIIDGYFVGGGDINPSAINRTYLMSFGLDFYYYVDVNRSFVFHEGVYKYFNNMWVSLGSTVTESDYINYGMEDISIVPEDAWEQLQGDIEFSYYTDAVNKNEVLFNIVTEPFTLAEEWEDQTIKIIEYSDDPNKTESTVTIETERFYFDDEIMNAVDVLYYTDDPRKTTSEMEVTANYSPLDELGKDPSLFIWTGNEDEMDNKNLKVTALPHPKLIKQTRDIQLDGDPRKLELINSLADDGKIKVLFSGDSGASWKTVKIRFDGKPIIKTIDINDIEKIKIHACSPSDILLFGENEWKMVSPTGKIRFAYYFEQREITDVAKLDALFTNEFSVNEAQTINAINVVYDAIDKKYYGLMFMDKTQSYYSTSAGEILQYLDMGTLIAGQIADPVEVFLMNTLNYDVANLRLWVKESIDEVNVEISETNNPFIAVTEINLPRLNSGDTISFHVRVVSKRAAKTGGNFDIMVKSDPA
ncbi:hypothetical protein M2277_004932 [Paenibacillus sp. LBL]|uniref:hypothetical protein n=1 Tax=Paenibacillus sp. LBL TaxID=2940563 RepID=UPI0024735BED|nr:hypothetical protein [Paenibacillus sp. LBL]MDH6674240.1 hypothetical protein [Paenibacillus sp. LBL]